MLCSVLFCKQPDTVPRLLIRLRRARFSGRRRKGNNSRGAQTNEIIRSGTPCNDISNLRQPVIPWLRDTQLRITMCVPMRKPLAFWHLLNPRGRKGGLNTNKSIWGQFPLWNQGYYLTYLISTTNKSWFNSLIVSKVHIAISLRKLRILFIKRFSLVISGMFDIINCIYFNCTV